MAGFMNELERDFISTGRCTTTAAKYVRELRHIAGGNFADLDFLNDVKKTMSAIKVSERGGPASDNTVKNKLCTILATISMTGYDDNPLYENYKQHFDEYKAKLTAHAKSGEKTARETEVWRPMSELMEVYNKTKAIAIKQRDCASIMDAMILALYLVLPPRRVLDFAVMSVVRGKAPKNLPNNKNYFLVENKLMIFNQHKNAGVSGTEYLNVSDNAEFLELFALYSTLLTPLTKTTIYTLSPLLRHAGGTGYNDDKIRNTLYRLLGRGIGSSMIRKIVATEQAEASKTVLEDMLVLAKNMGHSVETHVREYIKN